MSLIRFRKLRFLFLLALFFLTRKFSDLLLQLTLFTLAHSLTLGLTLYGFVNVPETIVEVAIALSIAFVAAENLTRDSLSKWRPLFPGATHFSQSWQTVQLSADPHAIGSI